MIRYVDKESNSDRDFSAQPRLYIVGYGTSTGSSWCTSVSLVRYRYYVQYSKIRTVRYRSRYRRSVCSACGRTSTVCTYCMHSRCPLDVRTVIDSTYVSCYLATLVLEHVLLYRELQRSSRTYCTGTYCTVQYCVTTTHRYYR